MLETFSPECFKRILEYPKCWWKLNCRFNCRCTGWSFMEVAPRAGDYAMMGVAALVTLDEDGKCKSARLVYLNAGDGPIEAKDAAAACTDELLKRRVDWGSRRARKRKRNQSIWKHPCFTGISAPSGKYTDKKALNKLTSVQRQCYDTIHFDHRHC